MIRALIPALLLIFAWAPSANAQPSTSADEEVLAVAEEAHTAISDEDFRALADLMVEGAVIFSLSGEGERARASVRTRSEMRDRALEGDLVERGFDPEVRVSGEVAAVWLPYDLYMDGAWSHCGVDVFSLIRDGGEWKIVSLGFSREQPPACRRHPDGPPSQTRP